MMSEISTAEQHGGRFTPTVGESEKDQHSWSASQRENRIFSCGVQTRIKTLFGFEIDDCIHGATSVEVSS